MVKKGDYHKCIKETTIRFNKDKIKTCPRGYCTAKAKYKVYPSAYANGYASSVCQGTKPDINGVNKANSNYMERLGKLKSGNTKQRSNMGRWFKENWVDVCKPKINDEYQPCGRSKAKLEQKTYPYCRPEIRIDSNTPVTVGEIIDIYGDTQLKTLCQQKRSHKQGVSGTPFYLRTEKTTRHRDETLDEPRLKLAIHGKTERNGGFNLPEFRNQIIMWMDQYLTTKQTKKLATKLGLTGNKKDILNSFKATIINDNRNNLVELSKSLGITTSNKTTSNKTTSNKTTSNKTTSNKTTSNKTTKPDTSPDMKLVTQYNPLTKCIEGDLYNPRISNNGKKKLEISVLTSDNHNKTIHFGHKDYQDYTKHRDDNRRHNYCKRSAGIKCRKQKNGICDQTSPNFWSRHMLWNCNNNNKKDICKSISDSECKNKLRC